MYTFIQAYWVRKMPTLFGIPSHLHMFVSGAQISRELRQLREREDCSHVCDLARSSTGTVLG